MKGVWQMQLHVHVYVIDAYYNFGTCAYWEIDALVYPNFFKKEMCKLNNNKCF